jgi:hypothetical protein
MNPGLDSRGSQAGANSEEQEGRLQKTITGLEKLISQTSTEKTPANSGLGKG